MRHSSCLLIHTPTEDSQWLFRGAPMSILYASAVLAHRLASGCYAPWDARSLTLWDAALEYNGRPWEAVRELERRIQGRPPALVGISTSSYGFRWAIELARAVKKCLPQCPVVLGGPHEDECGPVGPGASISDHGDLFDFSIQGDGEYLFDYLFGLLWKTDFATAQVKSLLAARVDLTGLVAGLGGLAFRDD